MKKILSFIATCICGAVGAVYVAYTIIDLVDVNLHMNYYGGAMMCIGLYAVALFYPDKRYNTDGKIVSMHKNALGWGAFFIYGDIISALRNHGEFEGFQQTLSWYDTMVIALPVIAAIFGSPSDVHDGFRGSGVQNHSLPSIYQ